MPPHDQKSGYGPARTYVVPIGPPHPPFSSIGGFVPQSKLSKPLINYQINHAIKLSATKCQTNNWLLSFCYDHFPCSPHFDLCQVWLRAVASLFLYQNLLEESPCEPQKCIECLQLFSYESACELLKSQYFHRTADSRSVNWPSRHRRSVRGPGGLEPPNFIGFSLGGARPLAPQNFYQIPRTFEILFVNK